MGGGGARAKRSSTHVGGRYFVIEAAHVETGKKEREEKRSRVVLDYGEKGRLEISERQRNKSGGGIEKKKEEDITVGLRHQFGWLGLYGEKQNNKKKRKGNESPARDAVLGTEERERVIFCERIGEVLDEGWVWLFDWRIGG